MKDNHPTFHEEVRLFLDENIAAPRKAFTLDAHQEVDGGPGRVEIRRARATAAVECARTANGETAIERRSFISRLDGSDVQAIVRAVRNHWKVENNLHGSLDMAFNEDRSRIRNGQGAENVSRPRSIALNRLKQEATNKRGIKTKRHRAGWDEQYLCPVLRIRECVCPGAGGACLDNPGACP